MRFSGIINIYVDSFKLLKLSVVVIESKNKATAAFQNIVLCSLLLLNCDYFCKARPYIKTDREKTLFICGRTK